MPQRSATETGWMIRLVEDLDVGDWIQIRGGTKPSGLYQVGSTYQKRFDNYRFTILAIHGQRVGYQLVAAGPTRSDSDPLNSSLPIPPKFLFLWDAEAGLSNALRIMADIRQIDQLNPSEAPDP